jgi:cytochrome c-type biogenesis protein CcmH
LKPFNDGFRASDDPFDIRIGDDRASPGWRRLAAALLGGLVALLLVLGPTAARADDPLAAKELQVEQQLGCPICTDLPLNVCDNQLCVQMKGVIRQKLAAGETPDQVVQYFTARYGDGILLSPPQQGFSLAVWYFPAAAVILGGMIVWVFLRGSVHRQRLLEQRLGDADAGLERYRAQVRREVDGEEGNW